MEPNLHGYKEKVSEYDPEMPQLHTADQLQHHEEEYRHVPKNQPFTASN